MASEAPVPLLREFVPADHAAVMHLLALNTPAFFGESEAADLEHYLREEIDAYFVVEIDGALVAAGGINRVEGGAHGKLSWDLVHPSHQGQGVGRQLAVHRLAILRSDPQVLRISVRTSQHAFGFYQRLGFVERKRVQDYWAPGHDLVEMEWMDRG
jgi:ribosomal protein S18 acetylase RimI-like enzyme